MIQSSPRKNGLTASLCQIFLNKIKALNETNNSESQGEGGVEAELIHLYDYNLENCTGCDVCLRKPNTCPLSEHGDDDMLKLEELMKGSSAIIIGAPSYFGNVPALLKTLIDRSRAMKMQKYQLKDKLFSMITVSGLADGGSNWVQDALIRFALIQGMIVVAALGHPVIMANLPTETLQKEGIREFRKPNEPGEKAKTLVENLADRIFTLLK
ncbi:MAG: flavodoxin family protein [Promethearchaeota archaeon]